MLTLTGEGEAGFSYRVRQVEIDYPTAEAAADVLVGQYERQLGQRFGPEQRERVVRLYADNPRMSTEPVGGSVFGDFLAVLPCEESGDGCIETANTWGRQKVAMRKAIGLL